ncbi:MAG TPA: hypothetical protein VFW45_09950 [Candidatus Polarisedimenticolia bacterium]|nr:hypothetical protein [Candidatus Polarisedimenticolia bacterium]
MRSTPQKVLAGCAAALFAAGIARGAGEDGFDATMELVSARATRYEKAALGFSCEETVILGKFSSSTGENKREQKSRYDYLYEGSSESGYREIRMQPSKNGDPADAKQVDPGLDVPGAYDWALLFSQQHRGHFRFEPAGSELVGFHSAVIIAFRGAKTFDHGREIHEWSGKAWVDSETGNFVKVEAEPNGQEELLKLRTAEWRKSMRIVGVPVKKQPRGYRYRLTFSVDKFGLSFPGEAETRRFGLSLTGEEEMKERIAQRFRNYVFFNVHSEEDFAAAAPSPPPPAAPHAPGK